MMLLTSIRMTKWS